MSRHRQSATYATLIVAIVLFVASSVYSYSRVQKESELLAMRHHDIMWLVTGLEREHLKLLTLLLRYLAEDPAVSDEDVAAQYEVLWSRVLLLDESPDATPLGTLESFHPTVDLAREVLGHVDALLAQGNGASDGLHRRMLDALMPLGLLSHDLAVDVYLHDAWRRDQSEQLSKELNADLFWSFIGFLLSSAILLVLLFRQLHTRQCLFKTTQAALAQAEDSQNRFRDFAQIAAHWVWELDADLRLTYISQPYQEITGRPSDELLGLTHQECIIAFGLDVAPFETFLSALAAHESIESFEYEVSNHAGEGRVHAISAKPLFDSSGQFQGYRGVGRDVTETHRMTQQMAHQASHDDLTGLVNRREFEKRLSRALSSARAREVEHALCYLDLDQFKVINDSCGHNAGDELLKQLSHRLRERTRSRDTLARLGGDEFAVLLEHCDLSQAGRVAEALRRAVEEFRFVWQQKTFKLGVSVGLVAITDSQQDVADVLATADTACYMAKEGGRNRVHQSRLDDTQIRLRRGELHWVSQIHRALEEDGFLLYCQPIAPFERGCGKGAKEHFELLLRLRDTDGREVAPGAFLSAAERYHLWSRIDRWVVDTAFSWLLEDEQELDNLYLCSVNLSGQSLGDATFTEFLVDAFERKPVPPQKICFEITETAAIASLSQAAQMMKVLKGLGCKFALDDFGSGLSSFAYLKTLPVDFLKIDGLFVKGAASDAIDLAMVKSINDIGRVMGKRTIAEFVESEAIYDQIKAIGVDYAQGYAVGRPAPIEHSVPVQANASARCLVH